MRDKRKHLWLHECLQTISLMERHCVVHPWEAEKFPLCSSMAFFGRTGSTDELL